MALKGQKFKKYSLEEKEKIIKNVMREYQAHIWKRNMVFLTILLDNGNIN